MAAQIAEIRRLIALVFQAQLRTKQDACTRICARAVLVAPYCFQGNATCFSVALTVFEKKATPQCACVPADTDSCSAFHIDSGEERHEFLFILTAVLEGQDCNEIASAMQPG